MKSKWLLILLCLFTFVRTNGQVNLTRNFSFEGHEDHDCEAITPSWCKAEGPTSITTVTQDCIEFYWDRIDNWEAPRRRCDLCPSGRAGSPDVLCSGVNPVYARTGERYGYTLGKGEDNEFIVQGLSNELDKNKTYFIEYYVNGPFSVKNNTYGLAFFDSKPRQKVGKNINGNPSCEICVPSYLELENAYGPESRDKWKRVSGYYSPSENFEWFAIGPYKGADDNQTPSLRWDDIRILDLGDNFCPEYWLFDDTRFENERRIYQASDYILADKGANPEIADGPVVVASDSKVIFRAGNEIILGDGFEVEEGAYFETVIEPCDNLPCPPLPSLNQNLEACNGEPIQLGTTPITGVFYQWEPAQYLDDPNSPNPIFTPPSGAGIVEYTVTMTSICEFFFGGIFNPIILEAYGSVAIQYNDNPLISPSIELTELSIEEYEASFTVNVGSATHEVVIEILSSDGSTSFFAENYTVGKDFSCCSFQWTSPEDLFLMVCGDYKIRATVYNICSDETDQTEVNWDKTQYSNISISSFPNFFGNSPWGCYPELTYTVSGVDHYSILVYNQWGNLIHTKLEFVTANIIIAWDGMIGNNYASDGTYWVNISFHNCFGEKIEHLHEVLFFGPCSSNLAVQNGVNQSSTSLNHGFQDSYEQPLSVPSNTNESVFFSLYPNPSPGLFNLEISGVGESRANIIVYDMYGRVVYSKQQAQLREQIDLSTRQTGIYFLQVTVGNEMFTEKLVVRE
jgi:hypothetical protein